MNSLTTICINELLINALQDLIDEVRSYLRDESIIYRPNRQKGDLLIWGHRIPQHVWEPSDKSLPHTSRITPIV